VRKTKILFAASSGGHLEEIQRLRDLVDTKDTALLTEDVHYLAQPWQNRVYLVPQVNRRDLLWLFKLVRIGWISLRTMLREAGYFAAALFILNLSLVKNICR